MTAETNIHNILEYVIDQYLDAVSIIKLELTCKRYLKSEKFWRERLSHKYKIAVPGISNVKDYYLIIELMYEFDEHNLNNYLKHLANTDNQKESYYAFTYWNDERQRNKLVRN